MEEKLDLILKKLEKLDTLETQVKENTDMLQALLHRTDELSAGQGAQGEQINYLVGKVTTIEQKLNDLTGEVEKVDKKTDAYVVDVIKLKGRL